MNIDKSTIIKDLIQKEYNQDYTMLFGEMQYAFVSFLMGENIDSFNQWKAIFVLLLSCEQLIRD